MSLPPATAREDAGPLGAGQATGGFRWLAIVGLALLAVLSVVGAFLGADRARAMFNSPPLATFWLFLAIFLPAAAVMSRRIRRSPGLFAMHLGPALIIVGGLVGSAGGHYLAGRFLGNSRVQSGYLVVSEGRAEDRLQGYRPSAGPGRLPFKVMLRKFSIERYPTQGVPWRLIFEAPSDVPGVHGAMRELNWRVGSAIPLRPGIELRILRYVSAARSAGLKDAAPDLPAMEVAVRRGANEVHAWVHVDASTHIGVLPLPVSGEAGAAGHAGWLYLVEPDAPVRSFRSDIVVLEGEKPVAEGRVEVNHPFHFGGYHFYQFSFGDMGVPYSAFRVVSDAGLSWVYAGFALLVGGAFWWAWITPVLRTIGRRKADGT